MSCTSNNATPPSPAIAPGSEDIDPRDIAAGLVSRFGPSGVPDRLRELVPAFDAPFFQAGLAGYSDAAMRIIARRHGCPWCVTEALLDRTLLAGGRGFAKADLGELHDNVPGGAEDAPLAGQIMGSDPTEMAAAAVKMVEQGKRHERDYRRLAYDGRISHDPSAPVRHVQHLRLPGGEQLGRVDPRADLHPIPDGPVSSSSPTPIPSPIPSPSRKRGIPHPDPAHASPSLARGARSADASAGPSLESCVASFAAIDVNLACPVKKISRKARGGHWLAEPEGAIAILQAVRDAVPDDVLCTLKMRRSFDDTPEMVDAFWKIFDASYDMGYAWATVHARTVEQKYIGPSRWDLLKDIVERTRKTDPERIVFGSGDIWHAPDIFRMIDYTGVTGASVARGCIGNPWIFRQARDVLAGGEPSAPTIAEQRQVLEDHFQLALAVNANSRKPEIYTGRVMRKFGIRFAEHHPEGETVRRRFARVRSLDEWRQVLDEHYADRLAPAV